MRQVASIWLPTLSIDRWRKATRASGDAPDAPEPATVLVVEATHGAVIHAANPAAIAGGARSGGRLTDARALDPALAAIPADLDGDAAWLAGLARWATRWSPLVEVDGRDTLRLDVSGVAHLFGGERALAEEMVDALAGMGVAARIAIAPTAGAAWALSHYAKDALTVLPPDRGDGHRGRDNVLPAALAPLPVAGLRLDPRATHTLVRLGLKTIGDLAGVPRKGLARRFRSSDHPLDALDRALGRKPEPLTATPADPPPRAILRLAGPATDPSAGPQALEILVPRLVAQLEARRLGARRLEIAGYRVDGSLVWQAVSTAIPSREPAHLQRLLADKAALLDPGFGFDAFVLVAAWSEPLAAGQDSLVAEQSGTREVARLVDRLTVKLGADKVRRPAPHASHWPERATGWVAGVDEHVSVATPSARTAEHPRPPRMLDRPEAIGVIYATPEGLPRRFTWRRGVHDITRAQGPERIAPEWWRERSTARLRDYYRVEDREGRRFWIFREGIAGDGRGGAPEWYLHGLFG